MYVSLIERERGVSIVSIPHIKVSSFGIHMHTLSTLSLHPRNTPFVALNRLFVKGNAIIII